MLLRHLLPLALPLLLAACAANDIRVSADWNPTSDLAARKTFALAPGKELGVITPGGRSKEIGTDFYRERVNRALTAELMASGRAQAAPDKAQLIAAWSAQSETTLESDTIPFRTRVPRDDPWYTDRYETRYYRHEEQTLTVTLHDGVGGKVLWTGSVRAPEIEDASPENREKRVRELVRRLLEKLPKPAAK